MKIAICFYGQPRLYNKGYETIKNLMEENKECEFDFFFHSWFDKNMVGKKYSYSHYRVIPDDELLIRENVDKELVNLYKPKKYLFETPKEFNSEIITNSKMYKCSKEKEKNNLSNFLSCVYSKYKSNQLLQEYIKETNNKYDFVISMRFDILKPINLKLSKLENKYIYNCMNDRIILVDHFVMSNPDIMNLYGNTYVNIENFVNEDDLFINIINNIFKVGYGLCIESFVNINLFKHYGINVINLIKPMSGIPKTAL